MIEKENFPSPRYVFLSFHGSSTWICAYIVAECNVVCESLRIPRVYVSFYLRLGVRSTERVAITISGHYDRMDRVHAAPLSMN